jgi:Domain of unknown function (DUF5134)
MTSPTWILNSLTILMLLVAVAAAWRIANGWIPVAIRTIAGLEGGHYLLRGVGEADTDVAQMLMAAAMAGMLAPRLTVLSARGWETIFMLFATWFGWQCISDGRKNGFGRLMRGHGIAHFFHCTATVYMLAALHTMPVCSEIASLRKCPAPALIIAMVLVYHCLWDLIPQHAKRHALSSAQDSASVVACRLAMGTGMAVMLLTMN